MSDNPTLPYVGKIAGDEVTYSGDAGVPVQLQRDVHVVGAEGSKTVVDLVTNASPATTAYAKVIRDVPVGAPFHLVLAGSANANNVKASPGVVVAIEGINVAPSFAPFYLKFHNTAGTPTAGSTPVVWTVPFQAGQSVEMSIPRGVSFSAGIAITVVTGIAASDSTGVTLNDGVINVFFE